MIQSAENCSNISNNHHHNYCFNYWKKTGILWHIFHIFYILHLFNIFIYLSYIFIILFVFLIIIIFSILYIYFIMFIHKNLVGNKVDHLKFFIVAFSAVPKYS